MIERLDIEIYAAAAAPPTTLRAVLSTALEGGARLLPGTQLTNSRRGGCGTGRIKCRRKLAPGHEISAGDLVIAKLTSAGSRTTIYMGLILDISEDWEREELNLQTIGLYHMFTTVPIVFYREGIDVATVVGELFDDHIVGNTWCRADKIVSVSSPAAIEDIEYEFKSADAAIKQLAEFQGNIECGVGPDGRFYFRDESSDVVDIFQVGLNATDIKRTMKSRDLTNALFVRCNHMLSSGALIKYKPDGASIAAHRRRAKIVTAPEFKDWQDVDTWAQHVLSLSAQPIESFSFKAQGSSPRWPRGLVRLTGETGGTLCEMPLLSVIYRLTGDEIEIGYGIGDEDAEYTIGDEIEALRREIVALENQELSNDRMTHTGFEEFKQYVQQDALTVGAYNFAVTEFEEEAT